MQEHLIIKLSGISLNGMISRAAEPGSILLNEFLFNKNRIEDLLMGYYFNARGRVFNVMINKPVMEDESNGYLYVHYSIGHFNACADVDSFHEEKMKLSFVLNMDKAELNISGEYFPEREPDEF
ncbi:hypothetical protein [Desertivirga xinjiangensis]|uniref:hypothetical protein n=1 Tax=Desertivirga xinjiangensis TaxID=539206 RepID=UPI00210B80C1|nr:hypothetical protein [Pedobacter xinjiangensis]